MERVTLVHQLRVTAAVVDLEAVAVAMLAITEQAVLLFLPIQQVPLPQQVET